MMKGKDILISVVAPAYNEEENIEVVIRNWNAVLAESGDAAEIVVCDDGSTDRTPLILEELRKKIEDLRVVRASRNGGYGDALFKAIYASRGEYVVTLDSDGQFDLSDYPRLLEECRRKKYDVVTGYRVTKRDSFLRVAADRVLNLIVRGLFGLPYRDTNCALKIFKGDLIRKVCVEARAYPTPTEIMIRLKEQGACIGEVAIQHYERTGGKSHLKLFHTGWEMLLFLVYLRYKLFLKRARIINRI